MARPRKFVEEQVVASAGEVFALQGYAGTTLDDLVKATGLGKQSLYNSFGGKRELFLRALSSDTDDAVAAVDEALGGTSATPLERIRAQLLKIAIAVSNEEEGGSLFIKATVELGRSDPTVSESALQAYKNLEEIYRRCIVDAQESGEIDSSAEPGPLAAFYVALTRGMEVLGTAGVTRAELTAIALTSLKTLPLTRLGIETSPERLPQDRPSR